MSRVEAPKENAREWPEKLAGAGAELGVLRGAPPKPTDCDSSLNAASSWQCLDPPTSITEPTIGATITPRRT